MLVAKTVKYTIAVAIVVLNAPTSEAACEGCKKSVMAMEPKASAHTPRNTWKELSHSAL